MAKYYLLPKRLAKRAPWTRQPVWFLEGLFIRGLMGLVRLFSLPVGTRFLGSLFATLGYRNDKKRRVARRNLQFALPHLSEEERERAVREVFYYAGVGAAELLFLDRIWAKRDELLEFSIHPEALLVIKKRRPAIYASAHVGAWQLANLANREFNLNNSVLYHEDANPWLRRFFSKRREAFAARMVPATGSARQLLRELEKGNSVAAAFDTRPEEGAIVPFFGVPTPSNTVPARLSLRGYPLIPVRCLRLSGMRYRIEMAAPLRPRNPEASRREQALDITAQLNQQFEEWIRETPTQWFCLKRRWPKEATPCETRNPPAENQTPAAHQSE
jgi:lauroyl/myristoyl acyltransferase